GHRLPGLHLAQGGGQRTAGGGEGAGQPLRGRRDDGREICVHCGPSERLGKGSLPSHRSPPRERPGVMQTSSAAWYRPHRRTGPAITRRADGPGTPPGHPRSRDVGSRPVGDRAGPLLVEGYGWRPSRVRDSAGPVVRTRLLGRPALALGGPDAVRFFYDERNVQRHRAIPEPVLGTLFGHGAVHTLDGPAHRARKGLFLPLMEPDRIARLVDHVTAAWDEAVLAWSGRDSVVLFDEASTVLTRGVHHWAGVPPADAGAESTARDMIAMVDGFATAG